MSPREESNSHLNSPSRVDVYEVNAKPSIHPRTQNKAMSTIIINCFVFDSKNPFPPFYTKRHFSVDMDITILGEWEL